MCSNTQFSKYSPTTVGLKFLDFHFWEHLKFLMYSALIENKETLYQRMFDVCFTIRNYPRPRVRWFK